jgi:hypothetical protein
MVMVMIMVMVMVMHLFVVLAGTLIAATAADALGLHPYISSGAGSFKFSVFFCPDLDRNSRKCNG